MQVFVRDNNVYQALRALKKRLQCESIFRLIKLRKHYEKPSGRKVREKAEASEGRENLRARNCSGRDFCHPPNLGWNELPEEERVRRVFLALDLDATQKALKPGVRRSIVVSVQGWGN